MANTWNCTDISKNQYELYNISVGIISAQRNALVMKRSVPLYDFTAFGKAIKAARMAKGESRKNVSDPVRIALLFELVDILSPRYLANIENKGQQPMPAE